MLTPYFSTHGKQDKYLAPFRTGYLVCALTISYSLICKCPRGGFMHTKRLLSNSQPIIDAYYSTTAFTLRLLRAFICFLKSSHSDRYAWKLRPPRGWRGGGVVVLGWRRVGWGPETLRQTTASDISGVSCGTSFNGYIGFMFRFFLQDEGGSPTDLLISHK